MTGAVERVEDELTLLVQRAQRVRLHDDSGLRVLERSVYRVLGRVYDDDGVRLSRLAADFGVEMSTVSRQITALQDAGLIRSEPDPADGRARLLGVTAAGRDAVERTRALRRAMLREALTGWSPQDVEVLAALLSRFNADMAEHATARSG